MIICPSCGSSRIRNDYKPAPLTLRMVGIRALLCDQCNHQFRAFSLIPRKSRPAHDPKRLADVFNPAPMVDLNRLNQESQRPTQKQTTRIILNPFPQASESQTTVTGELLALDRRDLRTEITKLHEFGRRDLSGRRTTAPAIAEKSVIFCPECNSQNVQRRPRNGFERAFFSFIQYKAFICQSCEASFYAKIGDDQGGKSKTTTATT